MQGPPGNIRIHWIGSAETTAMAQAFYTQASAHMQSGHISDALICLHKARLIAPGCPEVLHAIGNCLSDLGQVEAASAYYLEALERIEDHLQTIGNYNVTAGRYPGYRVR